MRDALAAARDFVDAHYPDAQVAFLGGSAATAAATSTSDLDIFVLLGEAGGEAAYVETTTHLGWLVEAFVYSASAADHWVRKGRKERRPVLDSLVATGVPLTDNSQTHAWAERARDVLADGPGSAEVHDVDARRYALSALVDDLEGGADPVEGYVIEATAFREAAELVLLVRGQWLGTGKWLVRNLRTVDDCGLSSWAAGDRDPVVLASHCRAVLDAAGGFLQDGFVRGDKGGG